MFAVVGGGLDGIELNRRRKKPNDAVSEVVSAELEQFQEIRRKEKNNVPKSIILHTITILLFQIRSSR